MIERITIARFFAMEQTLPMIDVRSPGEFEKGHIPQAVNIPLFENKERATVGTIYKQQSKEEAIELGYKYVTPKLQYFIDKSKEIAQNGIVAVHCWRGGMRSMSFAEHLDKNGFDKVYVIIGGYKSYRNHVLNFFECPLRLHVLGGYTGSGKTYLLKEMMRLGQQVIDLEGLAHHKGSAFGALGEKPQPSSEHFENLLFATWRHFNPDIPVWVEDESARIGAVQLPRGLYRQIREQNLFFIDIPKEKRAEHLVEDYGKFDKELLTKSILNIKKRLGGQHVKTALKELENGNLKEVAILTLTYYDKAYSYGVSIRNQDKIIPIQLKDVNINNAIKVIEIAQEINT